MSEQAIRSGVPKRAATTGEGCTDGIKDDRFGHDLTPEIRNTKSEIRNKFKSPNAKIQNQLAARLAHLNLAFGICFEFRISGFGFAPFVLAIFPPCSYSTLRRFHVAIRGAAP
jgi:hypothetical protein